MDLNPALKIEAFLCPFSGTKELVVVGCKLSFCTSVLEFGGVDSIQL